MRPPVPQGVFLCPSSVFPPSGRARPSHERRIAEARTGSQLWSGGVVQVTGERTGGGYQNYSRYLHYITQPLPACLSGYDIIVSWDTEWVMRSNDPSAPVNERVSYQFAILYRDNNALAYQELISYPRHGERLTLKHALSLILKASHVGWRRAAHTKILSIAHYAAAEVCALGYKDRARLMDMLDETQGTPMTRQAPLRRRATFEGGHSTTVSIDLRDTILLAPADASRSLAALSEVTCFQKIKIDDNWYRHMDEFAAQCPEEFEAYGVFDVRVALEYYLRFMHDFEAMFPGITRPPQTLGGAGGDAYKLWLNRHPTLTLDKMRGTVEKPSRHAKGWMQKTSEPVEGRKFTEPLVRNAFMGGLNIAYQPRGVRS